MFQFIQESFTILILTISIPWTSLETVDLILISPLQQLHKMHYSGLIPLVLPK